MVSFDERFDEVEEVVSGGAFREMVGVAAGSAVPHGGVGSNSVAEDCGEFVHVDVGDSCEICEMILGREFIGMVS